MASKKRTVYSYKINLPVIQILNSTENLTNVEAIRRVAKMLISLKEDDIIFKTEMKVRKTKKLVDL